MALNVDQNPPPSFPICRTSNIYLQMSMYVYLLSGFLLFQTSIEGPQRIPVSQQSQLAVVTPTPHQRVLGVSNGPQRVQRPVGHQKSLTHVSAVKSTPHASQNVDPQRQKKSSALQPKRVSQQVPPKTNVPKVAPEAAKKPEPEKVPSRSYSSSANI